jgi:hypothetical protein
MRALPRIDLNKPITFDDGSSCLLMDFNYRFAMVRDLSDWGSREKGRKLDHTQEKQYTCTLDKNLQLVLAPVKSDGDSIREGLLMRVVNWQELIYHPGFKRILSSWSMERQRELQAKAAEAEEVQNL